MCRKISVDRRAARWVFQPPKVPLQDGEKQADSGLLGARTVTEQKGQRRRRLGRSFRNLPQPHGDNPDPGYSGGSRDAWRLGRCSGYKCRQSDQHERCSDIPPDVYPRRETERHWENGKGSSRNLQAFPFLGRLTDASETLSLL